MRCDKRVSQQNSNGHRADTAGHWRDCPCDLGHLVISDIADQAAFLGARFRSQAVDANIDHSRARLQPSRAHHFGPAYSCNDNIRAHQQLWEVLRAAVSNRHSAAFREQQLRHRLAHQNRAANDNGIHPAQIAQLVFQQHQAAQGCAGHQTLQPKRQASGADRG